jgi:hypothetical protein
VGLRQGLRTQGDAFLFCCHVAVLQWAEENDLDWYSTELIRGVATHGSIHILERIKSRANAIPAGEPAQAT